MWNFPLTPEQASTTARTVDRLFLFELAIVVFFTALVCALVLGFAYRYRAWAKVDRSNPPLTSHRLEWGWMVVLTVIVLVMFVASIQGFHELYQPPPDAFEVSVVGKQWMWYLQHPEGRSEINELHLPVGRPVRLRMTSQDVIHSVFVPAFRAKQDVLPGRYTEMWFEPTKVGRYHLFCAEYCGTYHSGMVGSVIVMEPAEYERWLAEEGPGPSRAEEGQRLFVRHHCSGCHGDSQVVKAPRLEGIYGKPVPIRDGESIRFVTADDRYLRDSILKPRQEVVAGFEPVMPSYEGRIDEADLLKILSYLKAIGNAGVSE